MNIRELILKKVLGRKAVVKLLENIFYFSDVNLKVYLQEEIDVGNLKRFAETIDLRLGLNNYGDEEHTGESNVIRKILPAVFPELTSLTIFDIGANQGHYSKLMYAYNPNAEIFAFEPNPVEFCVLVENIKNTSVKSFNIGFADAPSEGLLFCYDDSRNNEHASLHKSVLTEIHKANELNSVKVSLDTVDDFSSLKRIDTIHFMKVDTEGYEFMVLKGASEKIQRGEIKMIQFEFNEMNLIPRIFLKDFYDILVEYNFFRITKWGLLPLGPYSPNNERFCYQNILAIHHSVEFNGQL